jgi:plasmid stabilization system protein ParE
MASVVVTETAAEDLRSLIRDLSLPADTTERIRSRLAPLRRFPTMGSPLLGRWAGSRFLLGPWPWMLLVYQIGEAGDTVVVTTIQDARRAESATTGS